MKKEKPFQLKRLAYIKETFPYTADLEVSADELMQVDMWLTERKYRFAVSIGRGVSADELWQYIIDDYHFKYFLRFDRLPLHFRFNEPKTAIFFKLRFLMQTVGELSFSSATSNHKAIRAKYPIKIQIVKNNAQLEQCFVWLKEHNIAFAVGTIVVLSVSREYYVVWSWYEDPLQLPISFWQGHDEFVYFRFGCLANALLFKLTL
jgi:hypothetical protein